MLASALANVVSVAPFTGAWIEITRHPNRWQGGRVAPFTGAWIEMEKYLIVRCLKSSLPSRERGLKFNNASFTDYETEVAPFTGAWIEIICLSKFCSFELSRSLHGSVD